ncbi:MAG: ThuA domain-containing protein [Verrucomicrobiota bacterium]
MYPSVWPVGSSWRSALLLTLLLGFTGTKAVFALEPWADDKLPVTNGLELWLDAARQGTARTALKLPGLTANTAADTWFDGSGLNRHVTQRLNDSRPRFQPLANSASFRFDGKDDFFSAANLNASYTNATVFIVAAPKNNLGTYPGFLAFNKRGVNDYRSGLNVDLGAKGTEQFTVLNAEGAGFGGAVNLLNSGLPFGRFQTITLQAGTGTSGIRLFVNGKDEGRRERKESVLLMDELVIGARSYSNTAELPSVQSFFNGDIAEVLIFNRVLSGGDRTKVENYLSAKHAALTSSDDPAGFRPLELVPNPPLVQMLVPGFTVKELPIQIPNINSIQYRADGKLVALGYNGQIHILSDTDGDGIEDKATLFWDKNTMRGPIGMALTPPGYARGQGVFVPSKGKLSLIVDKDGDDKADEEIIVATGWKEITQNVDAIGVALDKDGNIYFALGTANYANGYLIDKDTGKAAYDIKSERGTVLKVSPDFSKREIICTGIRFPVAMHFNKEGDLFASEQEGATWLPNGNPFDELLHIQPNRHYGFPPRHPKHLPDVVDEPSVFDYAPQHQSTCGFNFNYGVNGGPAFGPKFWEGDVLMTGESRGKIYRTKLVKTSAGYVAQNHLIACLNLLTTDICITPKGHAIVATHSGKPDWGTGPSGIGKLFQISYTDKAAPQPVVTYSASPTEIRIAFNRPLNPANLKNLAKETKITQGKYVMPGDRFESMWPGYQVIKDQKAVPRYNVPVLSANVTADNRTLVLTTPPRTAAVNYAIELPNVSRSATSTAKYDQIELLADLNGVEAEWTSKDGKEKWKGWLPHVDLTLAKEFTQGSAEHERLWAMAGKPGELTYNGQLDLVRMLQPEIQPGAKLDHDYAPETIQVLLKSNSESKSKIKGTGREDFLRVHIGSNRYSAEIVVTNTSWFDYEISLMNHFPAATTSSFSWMAPKGSSERVFPLRRFFMPGAQPTVEPVKLASERVVPELAGGNWLRGQKLFFSDQAACSKCHQVGGVGGKLGPDLSNLIHRDYASVLRDISEPSAAINPDHTAFNVELKDDDVLTGVVIGDTVDTLTLGNAVGQPVRVAKSNIKSIKPSSLSLMPEGLDKGLGEAAMKDLMTYLMTVPLEPAPIEIGGAPPARSRAELSAVMSSREPLPAQLKPMHIVLCAGPKDHGKGEHDYPMWQKRWSKLLAMSEGVTVSTADKWPSAEQFAKADVICFFNNNPVWDETKGQELDSYLARGKGAVYFHWAVEARGDAEAFARRIGLASNSAMLKYRHGPLDFQFTEHPLAKGFNATSFTKAKFIDESYWLFRGDEKNVNLLASSLEDGQLRPQLWTRNVGPGRVFVSIPGHYNWTFDDPVFRVLALRGICWSAGQPVDRLTDLAPIGARIAE